MELVTINTLPAIGNDVKQDGALQKPNEWAAMLYNDHSSSPWFVMDMLREVFAINKADAQRLTLAAHRNGLVMIVGGSKDIIDTKVAQANNWIQEHAIPDQSWMTHVSDHCELRVGAEPL